MRIPPKIAVPTSARAVSDEVSKLLRAADVRDLLPTPKDQILACARLIETGELELKDYEQSFSDKASGFLHKAMKKILGFLDRRTKRIYVDPNLHESRQTFVAYHETIHRILPWQNITYTEDDSSTLNDLNLDLSCETIFECEANYGAADILFQCDRFEIEARDYELSVASALYLAQKYGASRHSTLRRFVERNHRPCLLLVLKATRRANPDGSTSFFVSHSIPSVPFALQFGDPFLHPFINPEDAIGQILHNGGKGDIALSDFKGFSRTCTVESFNNQYSLFVMIYPKDVTPARRAVLIRPS